VHMSLKKENILKKLYELGFDDIGIANIDDIPDQREELDSFLSNGFHGDMIWLEKNKDRRSHPSKIWDETVSIIVVSKNYGPDENPIQNISRKTDANISVYARAEDYHHVIKNQLKEFSSWLKERFDIDSKYFVDTAPIMEKPIAQIAGLGWQGKHTNLVSQRLGSWFFLGVVLIPIYIEPSKTELNHCGSCRSCIDICPTNAIIAPHKLDARKCISYLTIEYKGHIPRHLREKIGNRVYGCDDCLAVCPWNKFAQVTNDINLKGREELNLPNLGFFLDFDYSNFNGYFMNSPIKRIGKDRFLRNILIAAGNSNSKKLVKKIEKHIKNHSPIVRSAAIWSIKKLTSIEKFNNMKDTYEHDEIDPNVLREWNYSE
jgi:epoxyqueuosine reductase